MIVFLPRILFRRQRQYRPVMVVLEVLEVRPLEFSTLLCCFCSSLLSSLSSYLLSGGLFSIGEVYVLKIVKGCNYWLLFQGNAKEKGKMNKKAKQPNQVLDLFDYECVVLLKDYAIFCAFLFR